ncbi:hypothetical protein BHE74_00030152, partial [Ensete ventricosum]
SEPSNFVVGRSSADLESDTGDKIVTAPTLAKVKARHKQVSSRDNLSPSAFTQKHNEVVPRVGCYLTWRNPPPSDTLLDGGMTGETGDQLLEHLLRYIPRVHPNYRDAARVPEHATRTRSQPSPLSFPDKINWTPLRIHGPARDLIFNPLIGHLEKVFWGDDIVNIDLAATSPCPWTTRSPTWLIRHSGADLTQAWRSQRLYGRPDIAGPNTRREGRRGPPPHLLQKGEEDPRGGHPDESRAAGSIVSPRNDDANPSPPPAPPTVLPTLKLLPAVLPGVSCSGSGGAAGGEERVAWETCVGSGGPMRGGRDRRRRA